MADARQKNASDVLQSYRRWKEEGAALKAQAQNLLVERFHELVREAQRAQHDLYEDFGHTVKFPVNPKFAKKGKARPSARKPGAAALPSPVPRPSPAPLSAPSASPASAGAPPAAQVPVAKPSAVQKSSGGGSPLRMSPTDKAPRATAPKRGAAGKAESAVREMERLARQVEKARQKLAEAKESGGPVKIQNAEDRLYELSDELRLLTARQAE